jgi:acylphosphatase
VQGVGFRYTARNLALNFDVTGFVRNLPDGRVELVVEGAPQEVEAFLSALSERMTDFVRRADRHEEPPTGQFQAFQIAY